MCLKSHVIRMFVQQLLETNDKETPVGRLNKKDGVTRYGDSHVKDKTS